MLKFLFYFAVSGFALSLEEKVGQVLMAHFHGESANNEAKAIIQEAHVGSIIYYKWANGLTSFDQVKELSEELQALAKIPLLIAIDQEGGKVIRLTEGFSQWPANIDVAETGMPILAEEMAYGIGKELKAVGINMNLAPVVDVNCNPKNPIIGPRSFGSDPEIVTLFAKRALEGYAKANAIATLKHFPGHGDVEVDSHLDLPVVSKSLEELQRVELVPFARLSKMADVIMTAHILMPAFDPDYCSTISKKTLDYLRGEMGFKGVIISDSLVMQGVLNQCGTVDEAAIRALNAGCDLLIVGGGQLIGESSNELPVYGVQRVHQALVDAVKSGRIAEERLDDAVKRVLALKNRLGSLDESRQCE